MAVQQCILVLQGESHGVTGHAGKTELLASITGLQPSQDQSDWATFEYILSQACQALAYKIHAPQNAHTSSDCGLLTE